MHTTSSDPHLTPQLQLGEQYLNLASYISLHYLHVYRMPFTLNPLHIFVQLVGQKIKEFRVLYDNWQVTLLVGGIPPLPEDEIAADFISKLDPVRYADFLTDLLNQASRVGGKHWLPRSTRPESAK